MTATVTPRRLSDGSLYVPVVADNPDRNLAALVDVLDAMERTGNCGTLPPGYFTAWPDVRLAPRAGTVLRGVPHLTTLASAAYATTPFFQPSFVDNWAVLDIIFDGLGTPGATSGPSILVVNNCKGWRMRVSLRNPLNNGIVVRGSDASPNKDFKLIARDCSGSGLGFSHGGGHMVALTGEGVGSAYDNRDGYVWVDGESIWNGGANVGSSYNIEVHVRIPNPVDEAEGGTMSSAAALRTSNGSTGIFGSVKASWVGRALRIGPGSDFTFNVEAEHTSYEAVLIAGGNSGGMWRGENATVYAGLWDCCTIAGENAVRIKSFKNAQCFIRARNRPGFTALRGVTVTSTPDLTESSVKKALHVYWPTGADTTDNYKFAVQPNGSDPSKYDISAIHDDEQAATLLTATAAGKTNIDAAAALNTAPGSIFRAYPMNGTATMEVTAGRRGSIGHRVMVADVASYLSELAHAGDPTLSLADPTALTDPIAGTIARFPILGEILDPLNPGPREMVLVTGITGDAASVLRGQNGTTPLEWGTTAILFGHLSSYTDLGGLAIRMGTDGVNIVNGVAHRINTDALETDAPTSRGSATKLIVPPERNVYLVTGAQVITWILGGDANAPLTLIFANAGMTVQHGNNINLWGAHNYVSPAPNSILSLRWDRWGQTVNEVAPQNRLVP